MDPNLQLLELSKLKFDYQNIFNAIAEAIDDYITITNEQGIILYVSPPLIKRLGYLNNTLIGHHIVEIASFQHKNDWNLIVGQVIRNLSSDHKNSLTYKTKNGDEVITDCKFSVVQAFDHQKHIMMVGRDIHQTPESESLRYLAFHDVLTELPNRRYLEKIFPSLTEKADKNKESVGVLYIDGDNFKKVNDDFGHQVGDRFLYKFGQTLRSSVRSEDIVIRIGGDEFVILLTGLLRNNIERKIQLERIITRIQTNLKVGWSINNYIFTPTSSIGVSFYPDHGSQLDELLNLSDQALYDIKLTSKNNYKVFS
nr:sensor domain-containing diguanylate cyclase [Lysinibacillus timonensis]